MRRNRQKADRSVPSSKGASLGAKLALQNARRHLRAADALSATRLFGSASSHVVLAFEELAKAWVLALYSMGFAFPPKMLTDVLYQHGARHAITFGSLYVIMIQHVVVRATKRIQQRHGVKGYPLELRDEWATELLGEFTSLASRSPKNEPFHAVLEWISNANDLKKRGLYVDFDGTNWIHPGHVSARRFVIGYGMAKGLIQRLSRDIRKLQQRGFQANDELNASLREQFARTQGASPEQVLREVAEMALRPISA